MKALTKDCPSCSYFSIEGNYSMSCSWGKRKKKKYIKDIVIGKSKNCNLKKGE